MSVYTSVDPAELTAFLKRFDIGDLADYQGICEGIENTNYFVDTTRGRYVMTLFEATAFDGLPFFLDLMAFLAEGGLPAAHPIPDREGRFLQELKNRPAAIVVRLTGKSVEIPDVSQCAAIGNALARMHEIGRDFRLSREDDRGLAWRLAAAARVMPELDPELAAELETELELSRRLVTLALPSGVIHADLFRDNALFEGDTLTGIIDFYYAFSGPYVYDLAVLINDWCNDPESEFDYARARAIADAYQALRPLTVREKECWPDMLRHAASRFWLSRLVDMHFPRAGEMTTVKDPDDFLRILRHRKRHGPELTAIWD